MQSRHLSVGLNFDSKCNARCAHCCVSSSPTATANLDDDHVDRILDDLLNDTRVREIGLTGGEPLLRRARTMRLLKRITSSGRTASCVTNGFWGISISAADHVLDEFEEAGLRELTLSYDDFHASYIRPERIRNVLDAARDRGITISMNVCVSRSNDASQILAQLGDSLHGIRVTKFPVVPAGEARSLPDSEFQRRPLTPGMLFCPGMQVIYHHDGFVYPCCSPPIFDGPLAVARAEDVSFSEVTDRIERNALLGIVQREGFQWFLDAYRAVAPDSRPALISEVVSACELCSIVFQDRDLIEQIRPRVDAYWKAARASK